MIVFFLRRLAWLVLVLLGLCSITFVLSRVVPGDPAAIYLGPRAKPEQIAAERQRMGLDRPLIVQFGVYLADLSRGDLGDSLDTHRPVVRGIAQHLPASLELMLAAIVLALLVGIPLGVISAKYENTPLDHLSRLAAVASTSLPAFWLAMLLQIVFFRWLHVFPIGGRVDTVVGLLHPIDTITGFHLIDALLTGNWPGLRDAAWHLALPAVTLASYSAGIITRMTRSTMLEVLREDYITTARAMGTSEAGVLFVQGLRNALAPSLTAAGLCFAYMLAGTFFIELIFFWPGLGTYITNAIQLNDYPVIMGTAQLMALFYVLVNLGVDLVIAVIDPRVRLSTGD